MSIITEYTYLTNTGNESGTSFKVKVNDYIEQGWQPLGGITVTYEQEDKCWDFWQAMVKYNKEELK